MNETPEDKKIDTKEEPNLTPQQLMIIESMKKIKDPYKNITVEDVAKDLKVGINTAYEIFKRDDFPAIRIGKQKTITLLSYLIWKTEKHY